MTRHLAACLLRHVRDDPPDALSLLHHDHLHARCRRGAGGPPGGHVRRRAAVEDHAPGGGPVQRVALDRAASRRRPARACTQGSDPRLAGPRTAPRRSPAPARLRQEAWRCRAPRTAPPCRDEQPSSSEHGGDRRRGVPRGAASATGRREPPGRAACHGSARASSRSAATGRGAVDEEPSAPIVPGAGASPGECADPQERSASGTSDIVRTAPQSASTEATTRSDAPPVAASDDPVSTAPTRSSVPMRKTAASAAQTVRL